MSAKILIVDDDINICQLITLYLKKEGYGAVIANDGFTAIAYLRNQPFDLVLLDVMMPKKDGFAVLREVRTFSQVPVIMLTARCEAMDKITGLEGGADDYITKPFEPQELILRIRAILRRTVNDKNLTLTFNNLSISLANYTVKADGVKLDMSPKEIELLYFLASDPGSVYSREQLFEQVWKGVFTEESRTVDVHVKRIRQKIGDGNGWSLETVWGRGYKFEVSA